jgi:LCP family protein required for cell wall assembly
MPEPDPNLPHSPPVDPHAATQPVLRYRSTQRFSEPPPPDPLSSYQPIFLPSGSRRPKRSWAGCGCLGLAGFLAAAVVLLYLLFPIQTRIVLLGLDSRPTSGWVARTDTIILMQVDPLKPAVKMLSIPRDLWVNIPGYGENRINTAHFFAEAALPGSGPQAVMNTIAGDFGIQVDYYARVQFDGFREVIDAMGGVDLVLDKPEGGLSAGRHHLNGAQALAFARDRKGSDDFFRMSQGQTILIATAQRLLNPLVWPRIPMILATFTKVVDTNLPIWEWPRLAFAMVRAGPTGIDHRTIAREMTNPFTTNDGAQVLGPNWDLIHPLVQSMFGK